MNSFASRSCDRFSFVCALPYYYALYRTAVIPKSGAVLQPEGKKKKSFLQHKKEKRRILSDAFFHLRISS